MNEKLMEGVNQMWTEFSPNLSVEMPTMTDPETGVRYPIQITHYSPIGSESALCSFCDMVDNDADRILAHALGITLGPYPQL